MNFNNYTAHTKNVFKKSIHAYTRFSYKMLQIREIHSKHSHKSVFNLCTDLCVLYTF